MAKPSKPFLDRFLIGLKDTEEASAYINAAAHDSDESLLMALQDVVRANQVTAVAKRVDVAREHLYRSLAAKGNPGIRLFRRILKTLDLDFEIRPLNTSRSKSGESKSLRRTSGYKSRTHRNIGSQQLLPFTGSLAIGTARSAATIVASVFSQESAGNNRALALNLGLPQQQEDKEDVWKSLQEQRSFNQLVRKLPMTLWTATQTIATSRQTPSI